MRDLLHVSRKLAAIAQTGLAYSEGSFDRERYTRLNEIAGELLQTAVGDPLALWPVETGYPTPKADTRGIVFRDDKVLLVKELSTGFWTAPGGWADVNTSPAENVEKECREESGFIVKARILTSVVDKEKAGYPREKHSCFKLYFLCELIGGEAKTSIETGAVDFFPLDALPDLDPDRMSVDEIHRAHSFLKNPQQPTHFN